MNSPVGDQKYEVHEIAALALLTGIERYDKISNCIMHVRNGPLAAMMLHLQEQVGKKIRVLRGHKLKSMFAPEAGIRYDGRYVDFSVLLNYGNFWTGNQLTRYTVTF